MAYSSVDWLLPSASVYRHGCNPSAIVVFQSANELSVQGKSCASHGDKCPSVDRARYVMIVQDQDNDILQWVVEMNGEQLPIRFRINRSASTEHDTFTTSLFTCESQTGGTGLKVISSTSASTPSLHSAAATGIESKLSRMTLRSSYARNMSVTVTRPTYWKASVKWSVFPDRPDRWMITLTRRSSYGNSAVCYFFADAQQTELEFPFALTTKAEYTVNVKALKRSNTRWADIYFVSDDESKDFVAGKQFAAFCVIVDRVGTILSIRNKVEVINFFMVSNAIYFVNSKSAVLQIISQKFITALMPFTLQLSMCSEVRLMCVACNKPITIIWHEGFY